MKRTALAVIAMLCLAVAACTPTPSPHDSGSQGYPDDPKAGDTP